MKLSTEQISKNMGRIHSKDTQIEIKLRKALWKRGFRFRNNSRTIYGIPDISIKKYKIAIFCDSEFWHGLNWDAMRNHIHTNYEFWSRKIQKNIERDKKVNEVLLRDGWIVLRFSDKQINKDLEGCLNIIEQSIHDRKAKNKKIQT